MIDNNSLSRLNLFQTPQELYNNYLVRLNASGYQENTFASYGYDAALTCALTLNASIVILKQQNFTLKDFNYSQSNVRNVFVDIMKGISFAGMTVSYALLPERNAWLCDLDAAKWEISKKSTIKIIGIGHHTISRSIWNLFARVSFSKSWNCIRFGECNFSYMKNSQVSERDTQDYALLQRQATKSQANPQNFKKLNWIYLRWLSLSSKGELR